jgi:hypothetical protein
LKHRRRISSPPPPSIRSNDIFLADHTGSIGSSKAFAQDVGITGWSSVGDAPPTSAGVKKSLKAAAHGNGSAYIGMALSLILRLEELLRTCLGP